ASIRSTFSHYTRVRVLPAKTQRRRLRLKHTSPKRTQSVSVVRYRELDFPLPIKNQFATPNLVSKLKNPRPSATHDLTVSKTPNPEIFCPHIFGRAFLSSIEIRNSKTPPLLLILGR